MNRSLPPANSGNRTADPGWTSGPPGSVLGISRLVGGVAAPEAEKPATAAPGGPGRAGIASALDRIAALTVFALRGRELEPELLADGPGEEPANAVGLPARGLHDFLQGGAVGPL